VLALNAIGVEKVKRASRYSVVENPEAAIALLVPRSVPVIEPDLNSI